MILWCWPVWPTLSYGISFDDCAFCVSLKLFAILVFHQSVEQHLDFKLYCFLLRRIFLRAHGYDPNRLRARRSFLVVFCSSSHLAGDLFLEWQIRCLLMIVGLQSKKKCRTGGFLWGNACENSVTR